MDHDRSFLGTGWSFPPTFTEGGAGVETVSEAEDIHQSLQILLATSSGERVMQEDFGCDMNSALFEEVDQSLVNRLTGHISDAILYHEPRISLDGLDVSESESEQGLLLIRIDYSIRSTNSRYNMVYPFYLNEAATPGV
jgi:phage baseplate assembly protein W